MVAWIYFRVTGNCFCGGRLCGARPNCLCQGVRAFAGGDDPGGGGDDNGTTVVGRRSGPLASVAAICGAAGGGLVQGARSGNQGTLANLAVLCFAVLYLGLGGWFIVAIRMVGGSADSAWGQSGAVLMFLACVKSADIGAYLIGSQIGRHPWVPSISPKKTWEGFIGGVVLAVIVGWLFAAFSDIMSVGMGIVFGAVVAVTGQLGDLLESMLKRDAGSKDSAKLVPEFGGALDLLDSVIVAAPFALVVLLLG